jgi:hypothetical protein
MAKNQVTSTSTSPNIPSMPTAAEMKRFDDSYAKLRTLFQWDKDAETDLLTACEKEMAGDTGMALTNVIHAMKQSETYEELMREYARSGEGRFQLDVLCSRIYLAGKMAATRYTPEALVSVS